MNGALVLIDINNVIVKDKRDVSEYVREAIRSRYGFEPDFDINEYEGFPAQVMVHDILKKNGVTDEEINARLEGCAEELGYSYYNVTGKEAIGILDGSKQLLEELSKKNVLIGIATGDIESIIKNKLQRANLSDFFKLGEYGNKDKELSNVIKKAIQKAKELGSVSTACLIASNPHIIHAAKSIGIKTIGVASGRYTREELGDAGADLIVDSVKDRGKIVKAILS